MVSCQCEGIEESFSQYYVQKELSRYRRKGPDKTTRILTDALLERGVDGLRLLDIGGGVGMIQYALAEGGVRYVTSVEASTAYLNVSKEEAERRGFSDRISYSHGNFVEMAQEIFPADIVTLDRVICCYDEVEKLVDLSAERAGKYYGLVYPRDVWWAKIVVGIGNIFYRLRGSPFRSFVHSTKVVEARTSRAGLRRIFYQQTPFWQVVVYAR
jgi:magnesium-protoporphyrin O-methyltransferase